MTENNTNTVAASVATVNAPSSQIRFSEAPWYKRDSPMVIIGGVGGIGSWVSLLLARAGFKPVMYDHDSVEEHNLGGQLYPRSAIGSSKTDAVRTLIRDFTDSQCYAFKEQITERSALMHYCVAAFDNMKARRILFEGWKSYMNAHPELSSGIFIDGRLEAEYLKIFCVRYRPEDLIRYEEFLVSDDEITEASCTFKQTSHVAAMIASHIVSFFTNYITNVIEQDELRAVPFSWEYFSPIDLLTVQNL